MKCGVIVAAVLSVSLLGLGHARAEVLQFRAEAHAGASGGKGVGGERADEAFHAGATGVTYGALVGVEFLFIDGWVEHNQFQGSDGLLGTWTQFMLGADVRFDLGEKTHGGTIDENGKAVGENRYAPLFAEAGMAIGYGVGTGQQVEPPLNNAQLSDKGFLGQVHVGIGYRINRMMSFGLTLPLQAAYLFKQGDANNESNQYRSLQAAALLNFRVDVTLK